MGSYTSGAEVYQMLLDLQVGPPARLQPDDIEPMIRGIEAKVDAALKAQGYAIIPATGENDRRMIAEEVRKKAAATVYVLLHSPERSPDWVRTFDIDFADFLKAMQRGEMRLVDQSPDAGQAQQAVITSFRVLPRQVED